MGDTSAVECPICGMGRGNMAGLPDCQQAFAGHIEALRERRRDLRARGCTYLAKSSDDEDQTGTEVAYYPADDIVERFAIRAALGNNGGSWADHYTEGQKEHWRQFVRDLIRELQTE